MTTRVQLALNVDDIEEATWFYEKLFGVAPHKERPGYANFLVEDPPLKLVLFEDRDAAERLNHLGIETDNADDVPAADARFKAAGLETRVTMSDLCCHAVQDKLFVTAPGAPNGWWEYYAVTDDTPDAAMSDTSTCCVAEEGATPCCA